ncbi:hypothetical protein ACC771_11395, partial [Rhizobium ruizarguesonis]
MSIDGRDAFAIFFPVYVKENGQRRIWGAVEVAIDQTMFYQATGLMPARDRENQERYPHLDHLSIAIRDIASPAAARSLYKPQATDAAIAVPSSTASFIFGTTTLQPVASL